MVLLAPLLLMLAEFVEFYHPQCVATKYWKGVTLQQTWAERRAVQNPAHRENETAPTTRLLARVAALQASSSREAAAGSSRRTAVAGIQSLDNSSCRQGVCWCPAGQAVKPFCVLLPATGGLAWWFGGLVV